VSLLHAGPIRPHRFPFRIFDLPARQKIIRTQTAICLHCRMHFIVVYYGATKLENARAILPEGICSDVEWIEVEVDFCECGHWI
jgi:hypothetical protein